MQKIFLPLFFSITLVFFGCDTNKTVSVLNDKVHTFYYSWYGNPQHEGQFHHWSHDILPHWSDTTWENAGSFPGGEDIGANYYPELGCYSSNDTGVIRQHMDMIAKAGIGVAVLSWWGKDSYEDKSVASFLDVALKYGVKVSFHIEPFYQNAEEFKNQLEYLSLNYGRHPALFLVNNKPLFYVYDSYKLKVNEWKKLLTNKGELSIRNTTADGIFIGLWVMENEQEFFKSTGFDGFYTYFASDGFVYGSTVSNWKGMAQFAKQNELLFIPCAGPGYNDTRIRPWNAGNTKDRQNEKYYEDMFRAAVKVNPDFIGITSFNEWHEGTQIEPAVSKSTPDYSYEDYGDGVDPWFYIYKTKELTRMYN